MKEAIFFIIVFILVHESIHYEINHMYGCQDIRLVWIGVETDLDTCSSTDGLRLAHGLNEVMLGGLVMLFAFYILVWKEM